MCKIINMSEWRRQHSKIKPYTFKEFTLEERIDDFSGFCKDLDEYIKELKQFTDKPKEDKNEEV